MSYASLGQPSACGPDEVWDDVEQGCEPLFCEAGAIPYNGACATAAELTSELCRAGQRFDVNSYACMPQPGTTPGAAPPAPDASTAGATASAGWAVPLVVVGAISAAAYWYLR